MRQNTNRKCNKSKFCTQNARCSLLNKKSKTRKLVGSNTRLICKVVRAMARIAELFRQRRIEGADPTGQAPQYRKKKDSPSVPTQTTREQNVSKRTDFRPNIGSVPFSNNTRRIQCALQEKLAATTSHKVNAQSMKRESGPQRCGGGDSGPR